MKTKGIIISTLIATSLFIIANAAENKLSYSDKSKFELYEERVENICNKYQYINKDFENDKIKFVKKSTSFIKYIKISDDATFDFNEIKDNHRENMNDIYKCSLLNVQKKSLELIKKDLIKKNPKLTKKIKGQLIAQIGQIKSSLGAYGCNSGKEKSSTQKLSVLHQATFQTCKYVTYLEYLRKHNNNLKNLLNGYTDTLSLKQIKELESKSENEIDNELEHIYKIFPLVFNAYTEYENNISTHFLLKLLKEDYIVLREQLHKTLNPINQVIYKIRNAMKK